MPLELLAHIVSHLKALIRYILEPRGQGYGSTFSICQALLKNAILLHIEATVRIFIGPSVSFLQPKVTTFSEYRIAASLRKVSSGI